MYEQRIVHYSLNATWRLAEIHKKDRKEQAQRAGKKREFLYSEKETKIGEIYTFLNMKKAEKKRSKLQSC